MRKLLGLLTVLSIMSLLLIACSDDVEEKGKDDNKKEAESAESQNDKDKGKPSEEEESNLTESETDDSSEQGTEEDKKESSENTEENLQDRYLEKVNDTKKETDNIRENPSDESTYALKNAEGDIYVIWDERLNEVYTILEEQLPAEEMDQLREEQREWIKHRDHTAKEASLKYEGGTMEQLEYVMTENKLTEERSFELVEEYMN